MKHYLGVVFILCILVLAYFLVTKSLTGIGLSFLLLMLLSLLTESL